MKISTILDHIDSGHMALPEFQRGYVWNREQIRGLYESLYRRHPVGGLLVWATESKGAQHRGDGALAAGVVKLLLDGQQRMTTLYSVVRGRPPKFFDGDRTLFEGLRFHVGDESFSFFQPVKMRDDPLWIDVTELLRGGSAGMGPLIARYSSDTDLVPHLSTFINRLARLEGIVDVDLHVEEVTGADKTIDVVVDIFNKVNSGGTKLSKGDLALAKICADWPEARETMRSHLKRWGQAGYRFTLDWLLRSVNTVLTGEARFLYLHDRTTDEVQDALHRAVKHIDVALNLIAGRLGLDHDQVLFGRFGIPVIARYLDQRSEPLSAADRDKLLFWFVQAGMWGRFSGSTETYIDQDLETLEADDRPLEALLERLRLWHGALRVEPGHFTGWSLGARFYPVLYMLTRMGDACDWGTGLPLKAHLLGKMNRLEVHHIFPKARLYEAGYSRSEVNAVANYCFLTKETNLHILDHAPETYFHDVERFHPGALASQWIPEDRDLWRIDRYPDFLAARQALLAEEANRQLEALLHGDLRWMGGHPERVASPPQPIHAVLGGITSPEEEEALAAVSAWLQSVGLSPGEMSYDLSDPESGQQIAVLDLAWPTGLQAELSEPVALLLNEPGETVAAASQMGFRCFTSTEEFSRYVERECLGDFADVAYAHAS
jgi:hypothetical protein